MRVSSGLKCMLSMHGQAIGGTPTLLRNYASPSFLLLVVTENWVRPGNEGAMVLDSCLIMQTFSLQPGSHLPARSPTAGLYGSTYIQAVIKSEVKLLQS